MLSPFGDLRKTVSKLKSPTVMDITVSKLKSPTVMDMIFIIAVAGGANGDHYRK